MKENDNNETAKCPDCGNKYLVKTGYCLTCKKKVKESIFIKSDFRIPGTDIILEAGDRIMPIIKEADSPIINYITKTYKNSGDSERLLGTKIGEDLANALMVIVPSADKETFMSGLENSLKKYWKN